eukprot:1048416_1
MGLPLPIPLQIQHGFHWHRASQLTSLPLPTQRINPNHRHLRRMRFAIQTTKPRRHYNATYFAINSTKLVGLLPARSHAMVVFCVPDNLEYLNQIDACFEWNYAPSIHHILKCRIRTHSLKYVKASISPDPADETYSHWYPGLRKVDPYLYPPSHRSRPNAHASQSPPAPQQHNTSITTFTTTRTTTTTSTTAACAAEISIASFNASIIGRLKPKTICTG